MNYEAAVAEQNFQALTDGRARIFTPHCVRWLPMTFRTACAARTVTKKSMELTVLFLIL
jgi:hypothetical protein